MDVVVSVDGRPVECKSPLLKSCQYCGEQEMGILIISIAKLSLMDFFFFFETVSCLLKFISFNTVAAFTAMSQTKWYTPRIPVLESEAKGLGV